jgi:hypothetical protein
LCADDRFWGAGFTEWTLLRPSQLKGIRKPLEPARGGLGYYNPLERETRARQAALARRGGLHGFCYYHYWFGAVGKVMHRVPEAMLDDGEPDLPFMLSWANEPWTRRWSGVGGEAHETLLAQEYGNPSDWTAHFDYLSRFWAHPKHIRVDGRPLFAIYRLGHFPAGTLSAMLHAWGSRARARGVPAPLVVCTVGNFHKRENTSTVLRAEGGALVHGALHFWPQLLDSAPNPFFDHAKGRMASWSDINLESGQQQYWGAYTGFDRRVRDANASAFNKAKPKEVLKHLRTSFKSMAQHANQPRPNLNLYFLTAWNEWNEQALLEPDSVHEDGMLRALRDALRSVPVHAVARRPGY